MGNTRFRKGIKDSRGRRVQELLLLRGAEEKDRKRAEREFFLKELLRLWKCQQMDKMKLMRTGKFQWRFPFAILKGKILKGAIPTNADAIFHLVVRRRHHSRDGELFYWTWMSSAISTFYQDLAQHCCNKDLFLHQLCLFKQNTACHNVRRMCGKLKIKDICVYFT